MIVPMSALVLVDYPREGLKHWKQIEQRARYLLNKFNVEERKESH